MTFGALDTGLPHPQLPAASAPQRSAPQSRYFTAELYRKTGEKIGISMENSRLWNGMVVTDVKCDGLAQQWNNRCSEIDFLEDIIKHQDVILAVNGKKGVDEIRAELQKQDAKCTFLLLIYRDR